MNKVVKMFIGEPTPDKNDPKYKEKYEHDVEAGRRFARRLHIDKAVGHIQTFANVHKKCFLIIVFGFVLVCFGRNIVLLTKSMERRQTYASAIERQDIMLEQKLNHKKKVMTHHYVKPAISLEDSIKTAPKHQEKLEPILQPHIQ